MPLISAGSTTAERQATINANSPGTSYCIETGSHEADGSNVPKTGDTYTFQPGAVIDGTGWGSSDTTQAVFRAHNTAISNVTIRNAKILNVPQRGIHVYPPVDNIDWLVEKSEIGYCAEAIAPGSGWEIKDSILHHCYRPTPVDGLTGGCILQGGNYPNVIDDVLIENCHLHHFGEHQKLLDATNCTWRYNLIEHSLGPGIWNDGVGEGFLAHDNTIRNCLRGIMVELSFDGVIRNNTIEDCTDQAIFVSTSRDFDVYENTIRRCYRAIAFFVNIGESVGNGGGTQPPTEGFPGFIWDTDLRDNSAHDNIIVVPSGVGVLANYLSYANASGGNEVPYTSGAKNNVFASNHYTVPSLSGSYFMFGGGALTFAQWQALLQDAGGTITT